MKPAKFDRNQIYEIPTWKVIVFGFLSAGLYEYLWIYRTHKRMYRIKHLEFSPGVFAYSFPWLGWYLFWRLHALEFGIANFYRYTFFIFYLVYLAGLLACKQALVYVYLPGLLLSTSVFVVQNILMNNIIRKNNFPRVVEPWGSPMEYTLNLAGLFVWFMLIVFTLEYHNVLAL